MKLTRWVYMALVAIVAVAAGFTVEHGGAAALALALLLPVLTFPLGVVGALCALPMVYLGIATPAEANFIAAPVYAVSGMVQWYIFLPRYAVRKFSTKALDASANCSRQ
jgi:hypothetical protein